MDKLNILVIDDERHFTEELTEFFFNSGFNALEANTATLGLALLKKHPVDLLILDVKLPGVNGLDILKDVKVMYPGIEVIVVSGHGDMETVIQAMRLGAIDYLRKPFRHFDIRIAIERTQKFVHLQKRIREMEEKFSLISKSLAERIERHFIGVSSSIREVLEMAITAAEFPDVNVLITGESGTGKENIARIIHYTSSRKENIFCAVNSSAITDTLLESEFFGHRKGSFTGAITDKKGFFEVSDKGTLFLDEIADMPMNLQAKMLRAIEEKKITRVGETQQIATDFRVISATNHDLEELLKEKKFRLDLLHRLNTLHIKIPPLRERVEDIEPLLFYFAEDFSSRLRKPVPQIDKEVIDLLKQYPFPGNIRELKNLTERAIILSRGKPLTVKDFPVKVNTDSFISNPVSLNLEENEAELIRLALHNSRNNRNAAAEVLGIHRMALARKMEKYNIQISKTIIQE
jgi:DNA-binding NtrC family response regulator